MNFSRTTPRSHRLVTFAASLALILGSSLSSLLVLDSSAGAVGIASNAASTISVTTPVLASGVATATVTVTVNTPSGTPISADEVTLTPSDVAVHAAGTVSGTSTDATNGSGVVSFAVSASSIRNDVNFTATDASDGLNISSLSVNFGLNAVNEASSISATNNIYADGISSSAVMVTVANGAGTPIPGDLVRLTSFASDPQTDDTQTSSAVISGSANGVPTATTNSNGVATFTVTDAVAEELSFYATDASSLALYSDPIDVMPAIADDAASTIVASDNNVTANGDETSTINVNVNDAAGNPVVGDAVTLVAENDGDATVTIVGSTVGQPKSVTDGSGVASFAVSDSEPGVIDFRASDPTDDLNILSPGVVFLGGDPAASTISATDVVDGSSTITVTELDQNGTPVVNDPIELDTHVSGGPSTTTTINNVLAPSATIDTNASGVTIFVVSDSSPETVEFDTYGGYGLLVTEVDYSGVDPVQTGTISATDNGIADGETQALVHVTVRNGAGAPVSGTTVSLAALLDGDPDLTAHVTAENATTNTNGVATFDVTDTVAEDLTLEATYTQGTSVTLDDQVQFIDLSADPATSSVSATDLAFANGVSTATVNVALRDANGNPIVAAVTIAPLGASPTIVGSATQTTNVDGDATFTVTDPSATDDSFNLSASVGNDFTIYSHYLEFQSPYPDEAASTIVSTPQVFGSGHWTSTVTVTVRDSDGVPLNGSLIAGGLPITLDVGSDTAVVTSANPSPINNAGVATFTVTDTVPETIFYGSTYPDDGDNLEVAEGNFATPSSAASTIAVTSPVANVGTSTATVTVSTRDGAGLAVDDDVDLASSNPGVSITDVTTEQEYENGIESYAVSASTALTGVTFEATDATFGLQTLDITSGPVSFPTPQTASTPVTPTAPTNAPPPTTGGVTSADYGTPVSVSASATTVTSVTDTSGTSISTVSVPAGALPAGTTVSTYPITTSTSIATQLAGLTTAPTYVLAFAVSWQAPDGTSPAATSPLTLMITDPSIKAGDVIYEETSTGLTQVGTATVNGTATITFSNDPIFVVAQPKIVAQAALTLTSTSGKVGTPLTLGTSGGTGTGAVTYAFAGGGTATGCKLQSGVLSATGPGTCVVTATKAADANDLIVLSSPTTISFKLPAKPAALTIKFGARASSLTLATRTSIARLAKSLLKGASVTLTGYASHNAALAKGRAVAAEKFLLTKVKVHVKIVASTNTSLNATKLVTTKQ